MTFNCAILSASLIGPLNGKPCKLFQTVAEEYEKADLYFTYFGSKVFFFYQKAIATVLTMIHIVMLEISLDRSLNQSTGIIFFGLLSLNK